MTRDKLWILCGLLPVTYACSTAPPGPPPEIAPAPVRFAYTSGTAQYVYASQRTIDQEVAGQQSRTQTALQFLLTTSIDQTAEQSALARPVRFTVDSIINAVGPGLSQASQRMAVGLTFDGTIQPTGTIALAGDTQPSVLTTQIAAAMKQFFPLIPADGPEPGLEWVDTTMVVNDDGSTRITKTSVVYSTAGEWSDEQRVLPISWRAVYTLVGEGQQMGQSFTLSGGGLAQGQHTLSADGLYLGTSSRDSSAAEIELPALGLTVPIVQIEVDSVRMVR